MTVNRRFILAAAGEIAMHETDPLCWPAMRPGQFDIEARPQPLALFAAPDPTGTPDLFDTEEES